MSEGDPKPKGLSLPGQPTEEAIADVSSAAGKSLIRGLGRLGNAYVSEWAAKREANAEAVRLAIETDARIKAGRAIATARREQEMADFEHRTALERRAERFRVEMAREQINLEAVERRAIEFTEDASESNNPREIDEDWLFRFADLAQKVSDVDVQALFARALSSAGMEGAASLSAAALQTLGLFDKHIAESFKHLIAVIWTFGFLPRPARGQPDTQEIKIATLLDLGLISEVLYEKPYRFPDFSFEESPRMGKLPAELFHHFGLSLRGSEIANAVFRRSDLSLSEEHEQHYLRLILAQQFENKRAVTILPSCDAGGPQLSIDMTQRENPTKSIGDGWRNFSGSFSPRLQKLLLWATQEYDIQMRIKADNL